LLRGANPPALWRVEPRDGLSSSPITILCPSQTASMCPPDGGAGPLTAPQRCARQSAMRCRPLGQGCAVTSGKGVCSSSLLLTPLRPVSDASPRRAIHRKALGSSHYLPTGQSLQSLIVSPRRFLLLLSRTGVMKICAAETKKPTLDISKWAVVGSHPDCVRPLHISSAMQPRASRCLRLFQ